eukprot:jgi/Botrbrau1/7475/Bobra.0095s0013.1
MRCPLFRNLGEEEEKEEEEEVAVRICFMPCRANWSYVLLLKLLVSVKRNCKRTEEGCERCGRGDRSWQPRVASEGLRPLMRPGTPPAIRALLEACWEREPSRRPSAASLAASLASLAEDMDKKEQPNDGLTEPRHAVGYSEDSPHTPQAAASPSLSLQRPGSGTADGRQDRIEQPLSDALASLQLNGASLNEPMAWPSWANMQGSAPPSNLQVTAGAFETAGARGADRMEDRHLIEVPLGGLPASGLLGVFDGHRGPEAAEYAARYFLPTLRHHWTAASAGGGIDSHVCDSG